MNLIELRYAVNTAIKTGGKLMTQVESCVLCDCSALQCEFNIASYMIPSLRQGGGL